MTTVQLLASAGGMTAVAWVAHSSRHHREHGPERCTKRITACQVCWDRRAALMA